MGTECYIVIPSSLLPNSEKKITKRDAKFIGLRDTKLKSSKKMFLALKGYF